MRVYKFRNQKWGIEALKTRQIKVSPIDELNDPFEYLNVDIGKKSVRKFIRERRNSLGVNGAVISFCSKWSNPVIWSHYADEHRGMALGFDIPRKMLFKMVYKDHKIPFDASKLSDQEALSRLMDDIGKTKFKHWKYESEYRLFFDLSRAKKENSDDDMFFQPFEQKLALKEVVLGCRYESGDRHELEERLIKEGVQITTARPAFRRFEMTPQINQKLHKRL